LISGRRTSEGTDLMREDLRALYDLQGTDDRLVWLEKDRTDLVGSLEDIRKQVETAEAALEETRRALEQKQKLYRDLEGELKAIEETIRKFKRQEFDVKTNEELWAIQKEIRGQQEKKSELEDRALAAIEDIDHLTADVRGAKEALERSRQDAARQEAEVKRRVSEIDVEKENALRERGERVGRVPANLLERYEKVRKHNRGVGVAKITDRTCTACFRLITPQDVQLLRRNDRLMFCEGCGAFMIWDDGGTVEGQGAGEGAGDDSGTGGDGERQSAEPHS
jgi:predicted  nucleic acid-binding Zn-ribbon protein